MDKTIIMNKQLLLESKHIRWKVRIDYIEYVDVETDILIMVTPRLKKRKVIL